MTERGLLDPGTEREVAVLLRRYAPAARNALVQAR